MGSEGCRQFRKASITQETPKRAADAANSIRYCLACMRKAFLMADLRFFANKAFRTMNVLSAETDAMAHITGICMSEWGTRVESMYHPPCSPKVSASMAAENPADMPFAIHMKEPQTARGGTSGEKSKTAVMISHVLAHLKKAERKDELPPSVKKPDSASIN